MKSCFDSNIWMSTTTTSVNFRFPFLNTSICSQRFIQTDVNSVPDAFHNWLKVGFHSRPVIIWLNQTDQKSTSLAEKKLFIAKNQLGSRATFYLVASFHQNQIPGRTRDFLRFHTQIQREMQNAEFISIQLTPNPNFGLRHFSPAEILSLLAVLKEAVIV